MFNFDFYNPTHIVFGKDRLGELDRLVPANAKVLVTYGGGSVKKFGILDRVKASLGGREVYEFEGIEPNPKYKTLIKALEAVRNNNIDFLLAVGGGSVIDGTKFIAVAAPYEEEPSNLLKFGMNPNKKIKKAIPLGTVVTLPATGSEMNSGCVISYEDGKFVLMNELLFPRFSILDPTLTYTLPQDQVANGIVDAFIHTVEQYVTFPAEGRFQDRTAEGILQTLIEIGKKTIGNPTDYDARANLAWCATMALNGLIGAGVPQDWSAHIIGHELTAMFGIDHGKTLAILLPSVWNVQKEQKHAKLLQYAERVWNITNGDETSRVDLAISKTRDFFEDLGIKTHLADYNVTADKIDDIVKALERHGKTALSETRKVTLAVSRQILEGAM
ncbi:iron-containing alcohol dehydrogenase [Pelotomaculum terephthalicicum JT]|uniref:iron-containing alcohol dehydrogenase n=1 Tax=Pelotomaculum TaxID=191373 RepID=UPI0009D3D7AE|nr:MULTISPECIES: iron-containing alcohol dehydrogenase [Pelotomaculum]MCG9967356.1 iron-containing alcohol dehydrogenase [Pelotomaculum terephthalicicum JT]OPX85886.1 MAG: Alcohol dehydrogenase YqhD [Pelotomaculum sp. PtaB.Bin117]OPY60984.1 MAG: Alcohol dehydrogenase YqhD [Pelotomaculum sp. PtaU1.Bin065]